MLNRRPRRLPYPSELVQLSTVMNGVTPGPVPR